MAAPQAGTAVPQPQLEYGGVRLRNINDDQEYLIEVKIKNLKKSDNVFVQRPETSEDYLDIRVNDQSFYRMRLHAEIVKEKSKKTEIHEHRQPWLCFGPKPGRVTVVLWKKVAAHWPPVSPQ